MLGQGRGEFPTLPSSTRFVELIPLMLLPLCADVQPAKAFAQACSLSTVCPFGFATTGGFLRIASLPNWHNVAKVAGAGIYGFKLHLVINEQGELLGLTLTP